MTDKPNIIYILGDDHRADFLGGAGQEVLRTPNLDQMASEGVYFPNAYCTSPACTPSRACHYLGQWERRHGINFNSGSSVAPAAWDNSFPMRLKQEGYFLGWVGKNHVPVGPGGYGGGYMEKSFDYWWGNHSHTGFYPKDSRWCDCSIYANAIADTQVEVFEEGVMNFLRPDRRFMREAKFPLPDRPEDRPFCLCVTFNLPHGASAGMMALRPTDDELYRTRYRDRQQELALPETYVSYEEAQKHPRLPRHVYNGQYIEQYNYVKTPELLRERLVREFQTITGMDRMVGHVREALERFGLADNTIIVFSTDHGIQNGEHGLGGKCLLYEESIRIPLVVYDPRLPEAQRGQVRDEFVTAPDLAPTMLDLCDVDQPVTMQGASLRPLMNGESVAWRDAVFTEQLMDIQNYPRQESLRTRDWKYIAYYKRTEDPAQVGKAFRGTLDNYITSLSSTLHGEAPIYEELFDLRNDPLERCNLAGETGQAETLAGLRQRMIAEARTVRGDDSPPLTLPAAH